MLALPVPIRHTACCRLDLAAIGVALCCSQSFRSATMIPSSELSTMSNVSRNCRTTAVSVRSCVVVPQCAHSPSRSSTALTFLTSCCTIGRTGYPMSSVCFFSSPKSISSTLQCLTISSAAFCGMIPNFACAIASAASKRRKYAVRCLSDQIAAISGVEKTLPKMAESITVVMLLLVIGLQPNDPNHS